jgi:hypothetical protein
MSFTRVSEIGEFGLIERLHQIVQPTEKELATLKKASVTIAPSSIYKTASIKSSLPICFWNTFILIY